MCRVGQGIGCVVLSLGLLVASGAPSGASAQDEDRNGAVQATAILGYPPGTILGIVYDSESRQGLSRAQVRLDGTQTGALTDALGRFTLRGIPPGTLTLGVTQIGYDMRDVPLVLEEGSALAVTVALDQTRVPLCGLIVCGGPIGCYSYEVVVRDIVTGEAPRSEVTLTVRGSHATDTMSLRATPGQWFVHLGAGHGMVYTGPGRDVGPYVVEVTAPGYAPWVQADVGRGECGRFEGNPHPVWLVPLGSDGGR